jgi:hypothetical protein
VPAFKDGSVDPVEGTLTNGRPTGSVWIKTTEPNSGARWIAKRYNSATDTWVSVNAPIYASGHSALYYLDRSGGGRNISENELFVQSNSQEASQYDDTPETARFKIWRRASGTSTSTKIVSKAVNATYVTGTGNLTWNLKQSIPGSASLVSTSLAFTVISTTSAPQDIADAINAIANFGFDNSDPANPVEIPSYIEASVSVDNELVIEHSQGGEIRFTASGASITLLERLFTAFNINTLANS